MIEGVITGLVVALIVEGVVFARGRVKRRSSKHAVKAIVQHVQTEMEQVDFEGSQRVGTSDMMVNREQIRYTIWKSHLEDIRTAALLHAAHFDDDDALKLLNMIDGFRRVSELAPKNKILPSTVYQDDYFTRLRELGWC